MSYNLVVIGAGPAGLVTAAGAAGLGAKVALIERDRMGGDCLNVGCVPSKALIRSARAAADVRNAGEFGVVVGETRVDFGAVMNRMRTLQAQLAAHDSEERFRSLGVEVLRGEGRFVSRDTIEVGGKTLRFRKAVIATGTRPTAPPIPGLTDFLTNETVFSLEALPRRLAVIGGGPIGCELAQSFRRFGAEVFLLEVAPQVLIREDADAAAIVAAALRRDGVELRLNCKIAGVAGRTIDLGDEKLEVDAILVAAGRAPNVESLNLEAAGIEYGKAGVTVDDRLRTTNPNVHAAGDVCSPYKFTHAADAAARIVIQNALFLGRRRASALTIPWCTYTDPEIAHVGAYDGQAFVVPLAEVDRAVLDGETEGFVKIHARGDRIAGATIVARHAGEMIAEIAVAMRAGAGLREIAETIHPYPTQAEAIRKAGDAYNRTRLTPWVAKVLRGWLGFTR